LFEFLDPLDFADLFDFIDFVDFDFTMVGVFGSAAAFLAPLEATEDDFTIFFGLGEACFLAVSFLAAGSFLFLGAL
jgi:hypothetical protein